MMDDHTINLCVKAIRMRADYMQSSGYTPDSVELVRHVAFWLSSDAGRNALEAADKKE